MPSLDQSYLDQVPLDEDIPCSSNLKEQTLTNVGDQDPQDAHLAKELAKQMQNEMDEVVKECMQWKKDILNSTALAYLTP